MLPPRLLGSGKPCTYHAPPPPNLQSILTTGKPARPLVPTHNTDILIGSLEAIPKPSSCEQHNGLHRPGKWQLAYYSTSQKSLNKRLTSGRVLYTVAASAHTMNAVCSSDVCSCLRAFAFAATLAYVRVCVPACIHYFHYFNVLQTVFERHLVYLRKIFCDNLFWHADKQWI